MPGHVGIPSFAQPDGASTIMGMAVNPPQRRMKITNEGVDAETIDTCQVLVFNGHAGVTVILQINSAIGSRWSSKYCGRPLGSVSVVPSMSMPKFL